MIDSFLYISNPKIEEYITKIRSYKELFEKLQRKPQLEANLFRKSTLRSSLFSARIEGNSLELNEIELNSDSREKREVLQIFSALKFAKHMSQPLKEGDILAIHEKAMKDLGVTGKFRDEVSAIFNQAGIAVYLTPPPQKIESLLIEFLEYINNSVDDLTRIAIAHFLFEKIHPFIDGNGRVGRILMNWHLSQMGYGFSGIISFEEYIEENRSRYYDGLSISDNNITSFVEFILEAIATSSEKVILYLQNAQEERSEDFLLPRRHEILLIIREQKMISFDQIQRRFLSINPRTLHYDLAFLLKKKLIKKLGSTKGAVYTPFQEN